MADQYWNARGGSHTDGGAFLINVTPSGNNGDGQNYQMSVTNKFGQAVTTAPGQAHCDLSSPAVPPASSNGDEALLEETTAGKNPQALFEYLKDSMVEMDYDRLRTFVNRLVERTAQEMPGVGIEALTLAMDRRYSTGDKKRSSVLTILRRGLEDVFQRQPLAGEGGGSTHLRINWDTRDKLRAPQDEETTLLIDARGFQPEGADCDARVAIAAFELGWRHMIHYNSRGTRFHAAGFGPQTDGLRIDCYDNPGDYLGSGMDGLEVVVHGNAQDQLGQITKRGKMIIYGDVGQTFLYGAKGGTFYIMGNAAGRPMINAVGRPKVVINGTALDFLAESFMAGNPLEDGGFAIVNGVRFDHEGNVVPLDLPYPGSNMLSLASGGAIYVRDPHHTLVDEQLNGGSYTIFTAADWKLILPYLQENERLFGIRVHHDLLTVDGVLKKPAEVYRKVVPTKDVVEEAAIEAEMAALEE